MTLNASRTTHTEISEIFSSLQGEGPYLGVKQVFVRFGRCNMHCAYCDEVSKMQEENFEIYSLDALLGSIQELESKKGPHHSISLTGGEPLFYTPFLKNWMPKLKELGHRTYLETNGTLPKQLSELIRWCDIIAMDLKPASSTADRDFFQEHHEFLKVAIEKEVFVKIVITPKTLAEDVESCVRLIRETNPKIPFVFQPLSDPLGINSQALELIEKKFFSIAKEKLADVRVIPQMHKIWGVR